MSIYTADIVKPLTQIFNQQPKDILETTYKDNANHNDSNNSHDNSKPTPKKPVAYVLPIEKSSTKDEAIQTDSISIDINSIINIYDFHRSERLVGKLDSARVAEATDSQELATSANRVKVLENELKQQLKINDDIKKLLIASLGEDLAAHLIKLTR